MPEQTDGPRPQPGFTLNFLAAFIIAFLAIAAYNTLELLIWIFHFFKRRRGLYFWSILACTLSVGLFTLASILQAFVLAPLTFTIPVVAISFPTMLAAQSLILYSRLHLISTPSALLRFVFWGIIVTSVFLHIPFAINSIGFTVNTARFSPPQVYVEWYMITGDVAREVFICGLYLYQAIRQLRPIIEMKGQAGRCIMVHLMLVNVAVIVFNVLALCVVYKGPSMMGSAYLSFAQSVKLRMEFVVLNDLLELLGAPMRLRGSMWDTHDGHDEHGQDGGVGWEAGEGSRIEMVHERERGERSAQRHTPPCDSLTVPGRTWGGERSNV